MKNGCEHRVPLSLEALAVLTISRQSLRRPPSTRGGRGAPSRMSRARLLQRNALGASGVFRCVDVEKRIDRLVRPVGDGDTMPRGPNLDLAGARAGERHARARVIPPNIHRMSRQLDK